MKNWTDYLIKKGWHFSLRWNFISFFFKSNLRFQAKFSNDCAYKPYYDDINKLYGFTDFNSPIHDNSLRFGWRFDGKDKIEIFAYWYSEKILHYYKMGDTRVGVVDNYELAIEADQYVFKFNDIIFKVSRYKRSKFGVKFKCFPYFGGNAPAPNNMKISIKEIN